MSKTGIIIIKKSSDTVKCHCQRQWSRYSAIIKCSSGGRSRKMRDPEGAITPVAFDAQMRLRKDEVI